MKLNFENLEIHVRKLKKKKKVKLKPLDIGEANSKPENNSV